MEVINMVIDYLDRILAELREIKQLLLDIRNDIREIMKFLGMR